MKSNEENKMTLQRAINWMTYNGTVQPTGINASRWAAMVAHISREYNLQIW